MTLVVQNGSKFVLIRRGEENVISVLRRISKRNKDIWGHKKKGYEEPLDEKHHDNCMYQISTSPFPCPKPRLLDISY